MRFALAVLAPALFVTSTAYAEERLALDFGFVQNRVAITDQTAIHGSGGRFAIRISHGRYFHYGAEAEESWLSGTTHLPNGAVARTASGTSISTASPLEGNMLALKALAGVHMRMGAFSLVSDVAMGMRDTWVSSDAGPDVAGRKYEDLFEVRSRLDVWLTPTFTLGLMGSADLIESDNVTFAAVGSLHFGR